jgi:tetratricopeptide (TPR) repeat protein
VSRDTERTVFVGRERELEEIAAALGEAIDGRGAVVLVSGEPGVGKTGLAREVAALAARRKAAAFWGAPREDGGGPAYAPWTQILRASTRDRDSRRDPGDRTSALGSLLPEPGIEDGAAPARDEGARSVLFDSVTDLLEERSARQTLVLVLEDLHAADLPSLLLLLHLAGRISSLPILVLGTYRPVEAARDSERNGLITRIARKGRSIVLGGLEEPEVRRFIEAAESTQVPAGVAERIVERTGGNPLFVDGVLRWLRAEGRPLELGSLGELGLPHETQEVIRRRLAVLPPACRQALAIAAVIGREFEVPVLADVLDESSLTLLDVLDPATKDALLQEAPGTIARRSFAHELVRATLYQDLPASERARLHWKVAQTLERAGSAESRLSELAWHFTEGILAGSAEPAVAYHRRAGAAAMKQLAYEDAAAHFERALETAALVPALDGRRRCEILIALGEARFLSGENEAAKKAALRVISMAEELQAPEALARAAIHYRGMFRATPWDPAPVDPLRKALRALGTTPGGTRALVLAELASALRAVPGSEDERRGLAREALELVREVGSRTELSEVLFATHWATWSSDDLAGRIERLTELVEVAEDVGDPRLGQAQLWLHTHRLEAGDALGAEAQWGVFVRHTEARRDPYEKWHLAAGRAMRALWEGRFADAERLAAEALRIGSEAENPAATGIFGLQWLLLRREVGGFTETVDAMVADAERRPAFPLTRCVAAFVLAEVGRAAEARVELDRFAADRFRSVPHDLNELASLWFLAGAVACLEDVAAAESLYETLAPYADRHAIVNPAVYVGAISHPLARLETVLGRHAEAERRFEDALVAERRMGAAPAAARIETDYARMLDLRGAPGDAEKAAALRGRALATARTLGMTILLERLEADGATAARPAVAARPATERSSFRREGDYWSISHGGRVVRLKNTTGLEDIDVLLRHPGVELHSVQLATGLGTDPESPGMRTGDAGELLDGAATAAYRRRLADLQETIEEAERFNDPERAARARSELDAIAGELAAAVGLGGRKRKASSAAERARITVTKRIKRAIDKISEAHPALGRHLSRSVRTGVFCVYQPDGDDPVRWS